MKKTGLQSITFYVTPADYEALKTEAETTGVTLSAYIHELVKQHSPVKLQPMRGRGGQDGNQNAQKRERKKILPTEEKPKPSSISETNPNPSLSDISTLKTTTLRLRLRVENNNKFVRGKKRALENIERFQLQWYGMKKLKDGEYRLTFSYRDDADLDRKVYDLLRGIDSEADMRFCFTEIDVSEEGTDREW